MQYADDVMIYTDKYPVKDGLSLLESDLNKKSKFLNNLGLKISADKTQLCVFSHKNKESYTRKYSGRKRTLHRINHVINFQDNQIQDSSQVSLLGIIFHSSLSWEPQIQSIGKRCLTPTKIINCLRHTWWGANPILLINLYKTLVRSRLDYGIFLFQDLKKSQALFLDRIQWKALRLALGYRTSTPTNVILAESCEAPLHLRSHYLGMNFNPNKHEP